jgi:putative two-component system response regulator
MLQSGIQIITGAYMTFIRNANQRTEISELITRLANVAEIKEWDNHDHISRIRSYCLLLSRQIGLSKSESEVIATASMLHDVGKCLTPTELLDRLGDYEDLEWKIIEKHTIDGGQILSGSSILELQTGALIAETHHERWDGSGYPYHRKGEEIPLGARICAIADVFDALTTNRHYKQEIPLEDAKKMIENSSGVLFDPKVVRAFSNVYNSIVKIKQLP